MEKEITTKDLGTQVEITTKEVVEKEVILKRIESLKDEKKIYEFHISQVDAQIAENEALL